MFAIILPEILYYITTFCQIDDLRKMSLVSKHYNQHISLRQLLPHVLYSSITDEKIPLELNIVRDTLAEIQFLIRETQLKSTYFIKKMIQTLNSEDQFKKKHSIGFTRPINSYLTLGSIKNLRLHPSEINLQHFDRESDTIIQHNVHEIFRVRKLYYAYLRKKRFTVLALIY